MTRSADELLRRAPRADQLPARLLARAQELERGYPDLDRIPDLAGHLATIRTRVADALGLARIPRAQGSPRRLGVLAGEGFAIERLVFEAVPGLPVPAHLYRPEGPGPFPAVVHAPGHWMENARLEPDLQRFDAMLARSGVAVLTYDTLGQGERRLGWHQHGQLAPLLVGFTSLGVMVTETLAALDLLAGEADVDATRLGVAGVSGGGFSSLFAAAVDERIAAAAICCIVNTHVGQIRDAALGTGWDSWVDLCNQVPGLCALGSLSEVMGATAPRRLAIVHALDDPPFPIAGAREVARGIEQIYTRLAVPDRFILREVPGPHGLHAAVRGAAAAFLLDALEVDGDVAGPPRQLLDIAYPVTHEIGRAAPGGGQTLRRPAARLPGECLPEQADSNAPLVAVARSRASGLARERRALDRDALAAIVGPIPVGAPVRATVEHDLPLSGGGSGQRLSFASEPGIVLDALLVLPPAWGDAAPGIVVLVDEGGKAVALESAEAMAARERGWALLLPDLRGTGESAASEFELATLAWMLDRDLLGDRIADLVRCVDLVSWRYSTGQQIDKGRVVVWGRGPFGLVALLAAALDERVAGAGASDWVQSLDELLVESPELTPMVYAYRLLERLDMPDLLALIAPRPVSNEAGRPGGDALASLLGQLEASP